MNTLAPQAPFEYRFLDESYENLYSFENRLSRVFYLFTVLALFIAGMGLFGLVANQVIQRHKEIGIRKVLGATISNIMTMLSKDFLRLIIIANLIAFPLAWWGLNKWLQDFAYRIEISWPVFAVAGFLAVLITLLTVGFQSMKAALANPVDALRDE